MPQRRPAALIRFLRPEFTGSPGSPGGGGGGGGGKHKFIYTIPGVLEFRNEEARMFNNFGVPLTITMIHLSTALSYPPTGANIEVGIPCSWPPGGYVKYAATVIIAGQTSGFSTTIDQPTWPVGGWLYVEIWQIGSTFPGRDLVIQIVANE